MESDPPDSPTGPPTTSERETPARGLAAQVPSLPVIEGVLQQEDSSYRERASSLDTKAGLILSSAGVVVALVGTTSSIAAIVGQALAIAAGGAAVWVILPRVDKSIGPRELRDRYLTTEPVQTRLTLLNTRLILHGKNETRLFVKAMRLRIASLLLLASTVAIVVSGIVNASRG